MQSLCTFLTTFNLSGAWSNRVSKASRSVKNKQNKLIIKKLFVNIPEKNIVEDTLLYGGHTVSARESPETKRKEIGKKERKKEDKTSQTHKSEAVSAY